MKQLIAALCLVCLACRADKNEYRNGKDTAMESIRNNGLNKLLREAGETRQARVANVQYYETGTKRLALVSYQLGDRPGYYNMAVEETGQPGTLAEWGRTYVCNGLSCNCLVVVSVGSEGQYQLNCNCSSCDLIVSSSSQTSQFLNSLSNPTLATYP